MDCTSCSTQLPLPPPPPSNVPPLLSTPPPPLSSTPPPPRRRTRRSSKRRGFKAGVATGSAVSLSSGFTFVAFFIVIYRRYFQQGGDKPPTPTNPWTNIPGKLTVPLEVTVQISVPDPTKKSKAPTTQKPPRQTKRPCCHSCASDCTLPIRSCCDSYVQGSWTQPDCVEWSAHQAAMGVTEPVNEEYYIEPAEYMWSKLCD